MFGMFFMGMSFRHHLVLSCLIHLALIIYGEVHDQISEVPYTDLDYKVFTDGARHVLNGESPFNRHTFRYSPILAYLMIPNIIFHKSFGKLLFSVFDILVGVLIEKIVSNELRITFFRTAESITKRHRISYKGKQLVFPKKYADWAKVSACAWLYNPLSIVISTRGNSDAFASLFVLATVYLLQKPTNNKVQYFLAGIIHGLGVHLRIYPIIFSLTFFLSLSSKNVKQYLDIMQLILKPNLNQLLLTFGVICSLIVTNLLFFYLYGNQYVQEAYIYHLIRRDTRHNFSLYFLMQYLNGDINNSNFEKAIKFLPQIILLLYLSFTFAIHRKTVAFCLFAQCFVFVIYNSVITSQYFVWFLALLPLSLKNFRNISPKLAFTYFFLWIFAQTLWLLPAYLLEFRSWNTFDILGIQSIGFFFVNIFILQRLINKFDVIADID